MYGGQEVCGMHIFCFASFQNIIPDLVLDFDPSLQCN